MKRLAIAALLLLASAGAACSGDDNSAVETMAPDGTDATAYAFTSTITIKPTGFEPRKATAVVGETLTFVNETSEPQTVTFINGSLDMNGEMKSVGPIAPGQSLSVPKPLEITISLIYESSGVPGQQGQLQIDPGIDTL